LLAVALPGYVLMFMGALWIYAREGLDAEPIKSAWVLIGFLVVESEKHTLRRICASRIHR
jgi:hypothetical protein